MVIRPSLVTKSRFSEISDQLRVSLYNDHVLECRVTFWRGRLPYVLWDPDSAIELSEGQFQTFPEISLPKKLIWKSLRYQNKPFIRGASPGIPYELWDKHTDLAINATVWVLPPTPWRYFTGTTRIFFFIMTLLQFSSNWGYLFFTNTPYTWNTCICYDFIDGSFIQMS